VPDGAPQTLAKLFVFGSESSYFDFVRKNYLVYMCTPMSYAWSAPAWRLGLGLKLRMYWNHLWLMLWDIITCGVEIQWKSSSFYKNSAVPSLFMFCCLFKWLYWLQAGSFCCYNMQSQSLRS
jgi:hypothetical protein